MHAECLNQKQTRSTNQATIGHIEDGPLKPVEVQEIANAAKDQSVIEVAQRSGQDKAEGNAQDAVVSGDAPRTPVSDGQGCQDTYPGKEPIGQSKVFST